MRKAEIERRLAICEAHDKEPTLRYVDLQERFHTGPSIVASALKGGKDTWLQLLGRAPVKPREAVVTPAGKVVPAKWEYIAVEVSSDEDPEGAITYQARDDDEEKPGLTGLGSLAGVLGEYGKLGWELAGFGKVSKGGGAFSGAWEAVFKRPLVAKGVGK